MIYAMILKPLHVLSARQHSQYSSNQIVENGMPHYYCNEFINMSYAKI
jgi:hypothetical protein